MLGMEGDANVLFVLRNSYVSYFSVFILVSLFCFASVFSCCLVHLKLLFVFILKVIRNASCFFLCDV